jgi:hypothetical protein
MKRGGCRLLTDPSPPKVVLAWCLQLYRELCQDYRCVESRGVCSIPSGLLLKDQRSVIIGFRYRLFSWRWWLTDLCPCRWRVGALGCAADGILLTPHPQYRSNRWSIKLLEAAELAGGTSGRAGGYLASWATPVCLADVSFRLHADLAAAHDSSQNRGYRSNSGRNTPQNCTAPLALPIFLRRRPERSP